MGLGSGSQTLVGDVDGVDTLPSLVWYPLGLGCSTDHNLTEQEELTPVTVLEMGPGLTGPYILLPPTYITWKMGTQHPQIKQWEAA